MTETSATVPGDMVFLGRAEKPHGLKGALSIRLYAGSGKVGFSPGTRLFLEGFGDVTVTRCTERGDSRYSLTFREIRSREEAEDLRNASLYVAAEELRERIDFVPLYSFPGMTLRSGGREMEVLDAEPSGSNPMLVVRYGDKIFHVPVMMVIEAGTVDWDGRMIEVELPEGMEDLPI